MSLPSIVVRRYHHVDEKRLRAVEIGAPEGQLHRTRNLRGNFRAVDDRVAGAVGVDRVYDSGLFIVRAKRFRTSSFFSM
jgi:hypothetical protein